MEQIMTSALEIFNQIISHCIDLLTTSPFEFGNSSFTVLRYYIGSSITVVATSLLTIIWLIGMGKSIGSIDGPQGPSTLFFQCFRLFIPSALISSYLFICNVIISAALQMIQGISYQITNEWLKHYINGTSEAELNDITQMFDTYVNNNSFWEKALIEGVCFVFALIFAGIVIVISLKILFICYSRFFKWFIVIFCCPIALACLGSRETSHITIRYFENLAKYSLQGLVILLSFIIWRVTANFTDNFLIIDTSNTNVFGDVGVIVVYIIKQTITMLVLYGIIESSEQLVERII